MIPYFNLILIGSLGGRVIATGNAIARRLNAPFITLEGELQTREGYTPDETRELFGEARLKRLEADLCHEFGLRRGTILGITASALLEEDNRARLFASGAPLILTCALNETLHRLYVMYGARFHDPKVRSGALFTLRRDSQILTIPDVPHLDTTRLSVDQAADQSIVYWREHDAGPSA
jgi:shikimate kinase